jgi:ABC-type antimicrobial peptide transport system permease subunit
VLGVTDEFIARGGFDWAASAALTADEEANPWLILRRSAKYVSPRELPYPDDPGFMPVVLDQATAQYGLHLGGVGAQFDLDAGEGRLPIRCRIVGLLRNSVLQGMVITSEEHFKRAFPDVTGYRMFLVEAKPELVDSTRKTLEDVLSDFGFDAQSTQTILADYLSVQNTYLSTFQTLGGLGLLLGTFGLAVVQLRNVLERRGELALLRAVGLKRSLLARLVLFENLALLAAGLLCGVAAALVAVLPHAFSQGAGVPWTFLATTLGAVLVAGAIAALLAVLAVVRMPILASLRGD